MLTMGARFGDSALITGGKVGKGGAGKSWAPGEERNWIRPCHSGPKAATAPKEPPAMAVTWQGLGSNFRSIPLLPWPLKTVPHSSGARTFARENAADTNANTVPGFPAPRVPSDNSRPRKEGLPPLSGVWAPSKLQRPGSAQIPEASEAEMFQVP